jgi:hypothetical protein
MEALNRDSELPNNPLFAFKAAKKEEEEKEQGLKEKTNNIL